MVLYHPPLNGLIVRPTPTGEPSPTMAETKKPVLNERQIRSRFKKRWDRITALYVEMADAWIAYKTKYVSMSTNGTHTHENKQSMQNTVVDLFHRLEIENSNACRFVDRNVPGRTFGCDMTRDAMAMKEMVEEVNISLKRSDAQFAKNGICTGHGVIVEELCGSAPEDATPVDSHCSIVNWLQNMVNDSERALAKEEALAKRLPTVEEEDATPWG